MGSGVIKTIILGIILVVLSFVLGSQAADGTKTPLLILGCFCVLFVFNYMGQRCWWLLFILPPVLRLIPHPLMARIPLSYGVAGLVLVYWVIMWAMGYVRMTWHGVRWLDFIVLVLFLYMAASFYRNPASVSILGLDVDAVGGEAYVWALGAAVYYLTLSIIPLTFKDMVKGQKIAYFLCLAACVFALFRALVSGNTIATMGDDMAEGRYGLFAGVSTFVSNSLFCAYPLCRILFSPWRLGVLLLAYVGVVLSGYRSIFLDVIIPHAFMCLVWRQMICLLLVGSMGYGVILYASEEKLLVHLPFGIQRSLAVIPGVEIEERIALDTRYSSGWRVRLWRDALDPRTGYIKDYVWGDGFVQSKSQLDYDSTHAWRATMKKFQGYENFAERGVWHNACIVCIHRLGIVGTVLVSLCLWSSFVMLVRMFFVLPNLKGGFFLMVPPMAHIAYVVLFYVMPSSNVLIFGSFATISTIKVLYSVMTKEGLLPPMFARQVYVPMAIRDHESEIQNRPRIQFLPRKGKM